MFSYNHQDVATPYNPPPGFGISSSSDQGQSRIAYFMTRNNGLPVPLIPADELPFNVKLQNVPRVLSPEQTYGLQYVGNAPYTGSTFKLERENSSGTAMHRSTSQPPNEITHDRTQSGTSKQFLVPNSLARQALTAQNSAAAILKRPVSAAEAAKSWRRSNPILPPPTNTSNSDATQSVIDVILNSTSGAETAERIGYRSHHSTPPPSGVVPDQEKKEYCTHWILQGWCAYEQQGCRYKHEMLDKEGLQKIGIRHVPRWWQERNAPIKLGGERLATVGLLKKPEEWFKEGRKGGDADSEPSSTTSGSESGSLSTEASREEEVQQKTPVKEEKKIETKTEESKPPATRPPTPVQAPAEKVRKSSSGSDLIDFAPLLPTPSSSLTSNSTLHVNVPGSFQILKRVIKPEEPIQKAEITKKIEIATKTPTKTTRVFVPAGESPEEHIAQVKKRERTVRSKGPRTRSPVETEKAKSPKSEELKLAGLSASRWAGVDADAEDTSAEKEPRKLTKAGCRPRRPASSSPAAKVRGGVVEKK